MGKNEGLFLIGTEGVQTAIGRTIVAVYASPTSEIYAVLDDGRLLVCGLRAYVHNKKTSESEMRFHIQWAETVTEAHEVIKAIKAANEATTNTQKERGSDV